MSAEIQDLKNTREAFCKNNSCSNRRKFYHKDFWKFVRWRRKFIYGELFKKSYQKCSKKGKCILKSYDLYGEYAG